MRTNDSRRERMASLICLGGLFIILFLLCRLYPLVGDDWYREALGETIHSPLGLIREVAYRWSTTNSRILANILAFSSGSRPLLREVLQASITLALIALLAKATRVEGWKGLLLWTAAVLALPLDIFSQIHSWAAGFFVFVPPAALGLGCFILARPVLEGKELNETPLRWGALFALGFLQELSAEHSALYGICAAIALLAWYRLERKKFSPSLLAMLLGCVLGAALLFASPSYRGSGTGYYKSGLSGGILGLLGTAKTNLPVVARYMLLDCPVLYISLTALTLLLGFRHRGRYHRLLWGALLACCLWLGWGGFRPFVAACVWAVLLALALFLWLPDRASRACTLFFLFSALVSAGPLLFVSPVGPRCLFQPYVLLLAAAGCVLKALEPERLPALLTGLVPAALAAGVLGVCFAVFIPLQRVELQRTQLLEEAVASGAHEVAIPAYDRDDWLWNADRPSHLGQYYYLETPGDITITFTHSSP